MNFLYLLYDSAALWVVRGAGYFSAAFSYYAPLALIPLLFFSVNVVGFFYGDDFTGKVFSQWGLVLGDDLLQLIKLALENLVTEAGSSKVPIFAGIFSLGFYITALNVMSDGFKRLWGSETSGIRAWIKKSLRAMVFLLILQLYFIIVIGIEFFISPTLFGISSFLSSVITFFSTVFFFTILYKKLVLLSPSWSACLVGSIVSSLLLVVIKSLVDLYIANTPVLSLYGAAGLILVLFVWVYIVAAIIYYGAAVAGLYGKIRPL